jgi:predicted negative regulator of RcsB-dependent stress response
MQVPSILEGESLKRLLQGAFVGFLATVVIGFIWGGWTLQSTAKKMAVTDTSAALVAVLAPICADKFQSASEASQNMAEFKKVSSRQQDSYIQKGGWATFPGMGSPDLAIAQACANILTAK